MTDLSFCKFRTKSRFYGKTVIGPHFGIRHISQWFENIIEMFFPFLLTSFRHRGIRTENHSPFLGRRMTINWPIWHTFYVIWPQKGQFFSVLSLSKPFFLKSLFRTLKSQDCLQLHFESNFFSKIASARLQRKYSFFNIVEEKSTRIGLQLK